MSKLSQRDLEKSFTHTNPDPTTGPPLGVRTMIEQDIQQAVAEERERCARVCERLALVEENWLNAVGFSEADELRLEADAKAQALRYAAKVIRGEGK